MKKLLQWRILMLVVMFICSQPTFADELKDFTSDGCSSFPDGTFQQKRLWRECCVIHDLAYWLGGTAEQRKNVDRALELCVAQVGEPSIAKLMLAGVRVGGTPWLPMRFRWGYGWPYLRGYKTISEDEKEVVFKKLKAAEKIVIKENVQLDKIGDGQD